MAEQNSDRVYPEGEALDRYINRRRRWGVVWRSLLLLATTVGVLVLMVLLINIVNDSFGFVAIQRKNDPEELVLNHFKNIVLNTPHQKTSEDDQSLAEQIGKRTNAIGYLDYASYQAKADNLRLVPIEGVELSAETVAAGDYSLVRPLYIYTSRQALNERRYAATFVGYYLSRVSDDINQFGYFPAPEQEIEQGVTAWQKVTGFPPDALAGNIADTGTVVASGSSTMMPMTRFMAEQANHEGIAIEVSVDNIGTGAGFERFCSGKADIVDASRPIAFSEQLQCKAHNIAPLGFRVATDGLAVVVSRENGFVDNLSLEQLKQVFTTAEKWSDVDPAWPDDPIIRLTPGSESGTLDFFIHSVFGADPTTQPVETLVALLEENLSAGLVRRLESEQPLAERSHQELLQLVVDRIEKPTIVRSWSLFASLFHRRTIEAEAAQIPRSVLEFRSWINFAFITSPQSSQPELAGIRTAILGSLFVVFITVLFAIPVGVGAAIYLEEYGSDSLFDHLIETNINNLAGVPSIIYGMLGLVVLVRALEPITSGKMFGLVNETTANGRTILAAGLTLGLLILPIIIINAREAIRAVPQAFCEASYGLGATKWQTIWHHVLPNAVPGILTGSILAISRAFGETAPLVVIGASTAIFVDPTSPFSKFTTLPIQIYQWTARPQAAFQNLAAAAIIVLLVLLLALNAGAILLRNRYQRSY